MKKLVGPIIFLIILIPTVFITLKIKDFYFSVYHANQNSHLVDVQKKSIFNVILLGYGGGAHEGGKLTDSMMVMHIDTVKKNALMISIPRDLWVSFPISTGTFSSKINSSYQIGLDPTFYPAVYETIKDKNDPGTLVKYEASQVTGLPVQNYVAVDFNSFKKVIDTLGGIDIVVDKTFDDYEYPIDGKETDLCGKDEDFKQIEKFLNPSPTISPDEQKDFFKDKPELEKFLEDITDDPASAFPCRYEHLHFDKGPTHLNGEQALKYARSRHSLQDGSDFGRATRQQKVVLAVKEKVLSLSFIPKIIPLMDTLKDDIQTDLTLDDIKAILFESQNAKKYQIKSIVLSNENFLTLGTSDDGQSIVMPKAGIADFSEIKTAIQDLISNKPTATPSATLKPSKTVK
jgi:LCP family protein required for cell wall assembly